MENKEREGIEKRRQKIAIQNNEKLVNKIYKSLYDNYYLDGPYFNEKSIKELIKEAL